MGEAVAEVARISDLLRSPQGCPWDREQTHASLRPFLLEEATEALEALDTGNAERLREELGDLLFHVVIHAQLAREEGSFDLADVARGVTTKLVRRHPHVFEGTTTGGPRPPRTALSSGDVREQWERIKKDEKREAAEALRRVNEHFAERVRALEARAKTEGRDLASYDPNELWAMWEKTA